MVSRSHCAGVLGSALLLGLAAACTDSATAPVAGPAPATAPLAQVVPGTSVFGTNDYVEYIPGNLPVIISAPHGGALEPAELPIRVAGEACGPVVTIVRDLNTQELARTIRDAFHARTGGYPHIIISRVHRNRLDPNRPIGEAACGDPGAELAWNEYHGFIETARAAVVAQHGKGWYTDLHGHAHEIQRLELGYALTGTTLRRSDATLDASTTYESASSLRTFSEHSPLSFSAVLRGPTALGTLFTEAGFASVPSAQDPAPDVGEGYFNGGYSTERHGCSLGGPICGAQIESHWTGVRNTAASRTSFATSLVAVYREFLAQFGITIPVAAGPAPGEGLIVDNDNVFNNPGWARFQATSSWSVGANAQSWETNFHLSSGNPNAPNDGAEFHYYIAHPGTYSVEAWWPALSTRSSSVLYRLYEYNGASGMADVRVDQRTNGARWNPLGTYKFGRVAWTRVLVSRSLSASGSLAADAIRVTMLNAAPQVSLGGAQTILHGETFTTTGSITDLDDQAWTATASYGDGSAPVSVTVGPSFTLEHRYMATGDFTTQVDVTDGTDAATASVVVTVLSPRAAAEGLLANLAALGAAGTLEAGRLNGLRAPLDAAIAQLERGNATAAAGQLGAFANQCAALVKAGVLAEEDAEELRSMAERIAASAVAARASAG